MFVKGKDLRISNLRKPMMDVRFLIPINILSERPEILKSSKILIISHLLFIVVGIKVKNPPSVKERY